MRSFSPLGRYLLVLFVAFGACTEGPENGNATDAKIGIDGIQQDGVKPSDTAVVQDQGPIDTYVPEPGEFGWPCNDNSDCYSGWCVVTPEGNICTKTCEDECPANYECRPLITDGDPVYLCLPKWVHLCDPCNETTDCAGDESDTGHYCLDHGPKGRFCGGDCSSDGVCPKDYECKNVPVGGGLIHAQCVPVLGSCECSKLATLGQLTTQCVITNDAGSCVGTRMCTVDGLSDCDAKDPTEEACNGLDDDCDGATDNMPADYICYKTNNDGTCSGKGTCIGGVELCDAADASIEVCDGLDNNCDNVIDEGFLNTDGDDKADCIDDDDDNDTIPDVADNCPIDVNEDQKNTDGDDMGDACDEDDDNDSSPDTEDCEPLDPNIHQGALEQCDGVDNDCNGIIDDNLCDDGNSCTIDSCNADGSCANAPDNQQLCDDGSICTQTDKCIDGQCEGLNPLICDDGNPCTTDTCDAVAACVTTFNSDGCEDGSKCTENDTCTNGVCAAGSQVDCNDGSNCTVDQCFPQKGCEHSPTNESLACNNPNQGQCQASKCVAGICSGYNVDGIGCNTGSGDCPSGSCNGGQCYANATVCEYDGGFCGSDVPGTCTAAGQCVPTQQPGCQCTSPCAGICVCCCIPILGCIDLCVAF